MIIKFIGFLFCQIFMFCVFALFTIIMLGFDFAVDLKLQLLNDREMIGEYCRMIGWANYIFGTLLWVYTLCTDLYDSF